MCCPLILLVLIGPRLAFLFAWIFTPRVTEAFSGGWVLPLLGFLFLREAFTLRKGLGLVAALAALASLASG